MSVFYVMLTLSILSIAFMGGVIGYLIGKYWKKKQCMKKIILLFVSVIIFLLVSCNENKGVNVPTSDSINEIKVEKLFVVDGITVYRFYDGGRVVYFTNKKGVAKSIHDEYDPATKTTRTKVVETLCNEEQLMYRPITMYRIVCDRCGEVFGGTDTCSALFSNKDVDISDYSDWEMIDGNLVS